MEKQYCPYCMAPVTPGEPCRVCGLTEGSYTPSPHHLPLGTVLRERYLVGRVLGEGGFGITYIGCDLRLELKVAIKEYFPTDRANRVSSADLSVSSYAGQAGGRYEAGKERFLQEARTMARMEKMPVIVSVRDFFEVNNTAYIVMEYIEGTTFKELVEHRGGRLPAGELLHMIEPLFFALKAMHQLGLIHRDISPENLMLEHGEVRLLDFGCAREAGDGGATLTIALKHGYAPVEQYQSKGQGPWTDVYALAATIYYCLTGRKPPQAMDRLVEDELVPPRQLGVELTARQEQALLQGMGVAPKRRFQSMEEFHTALYTGEFIPHIETKVTVTRGNPDSGNGQDTEKGQDTDTTSTDTISRESEKGGWKTLLVKYWPVAAGAAAVLALVVALAMWRPWEALSVPDGPEPGNVSERVESPAEPVSGPSAPEAVTPEEHSITNDESLALFANAAVLSEGGEEEFRAMLAAPDVEAIVLTDGMYFDLYDGETVINKPVKLGKDGGIGFIQPVTISAGGHLRVEGSADVVGLLRTAEGGSVLVAGGSVGDSGMIWLEKTNDLAVDGGSVNIPAEKIIVFSESIFENAPRVKNYAEYITALESRDAEAVVIAADLSLEGHGNTSQHKPVLIEEGVHVHAPVARMSNGPDDMTHYDAWDINGAVLVNRGTITGRIVMGRWESGGATALLNYGTIHTGLYTADECKSNPAIVNLGTLSVPQGGFHGGTFANLGTFLHGLLAPAGQELVEIPKRDAYWLDFRESTVYNAGRMELLGADAPVDMDQNGYCDMTFTRNTRFENAGTVEIGQYATLHNESWLRNHETIHVAEGGNFENYTLVENASPNSVLDAANGCYSTGIIQSGPEVELKLSADAFRHGGARLDFAWGSGVPEGTRFVTTAQELQDANMDGDCKAVWLTNGASIRLGEPLRVTKGLIIPDATLTAGGLTVAGDGYVVSSGAINLQGGELRMEGNSKGVIHTLRSCGGIFIADVANVALTDGEEMMNQNPNVSLTLRQGHITTLNSPLKLEGTSVDIKNGVLRVCGGLDMRDCTVTLGDQDGQGGEFLINGGDAYIDQYTTVTVHSGAGFGIGGTDTGLGGSFDVNLGGSFENYGQLGTDGSEWISGNVVNHGLFHSWNNENNPIILAGSFVNDGQMEFPNGGKFRVTSSATVKGVPEEYQDG